MHSKLSLFPSSPSRPNHRLARKLYHAATSEAIGPDAEKLLEHYSRPDQICHQRGHKAFMVSSVRCFREGYNVTDDTEPEWTARADPGSRVCRDQRRQGP